MTKYRAYYKATASMSVEVEADDEAAAMDAADEEFAPPSLCHQCAGHMDLSDWEPDDSEWGIEEIEA